MAYDHERAIGCVIGYNAVIKAIKFVEANEIIPPYASAHLRRVLKTVYGRETYNYYLHRRRKPKLVRAR
jgi:hypothetical protein